MFRTFLATSTNLSHYLKAALEIKTTCQNFGLAKLSFYRTRVLLCFMTFFYYFPGRRSYRIP